jgi:hypothetical protein
MKRTPLLSMLVAALAFPASAQTTLMPVAEATIRDGGNSGVDINEAALGYTMVKYGTGNAAKSYYKFNFAGQNANTNNALTFTFTTQTASQRQLVQMWSLEQAYPTFTDSVMVWNTAQANNTTNNSMRTSGAFTARPLLEFLSPTTAGVLRNITIPAPWGDLLVGNDLVLVLTANEDPGNQANGLRLRTNATFVSFAELIGAPPSISAISNLTVY